MAEEDFREKLNAALESAIAGDADLDEVDAPPALKDARGRVQEIRTLRGSVDP